jgi:serine O-acetyltransferase
MHRLAHRLYRIALPFFPVDFAYCAISDRHPRIHPGATISPQVFIDHGAGVVIGEQLLLATMH